MSSQVRIPPVEAIIEAHGREMSRARQQSNIRDRNMLESAYARPLHRATYDEEATVFDIAAELGFGLARHQAFRDGNKRAAFAATYMILKMNGLSPDWTNRDAIETFNQLAAGELDVTGFSKWLAGNVLNRKKTAK